MAMVALLVLAPAAAADQSPTVRVDVTVSPPSEGHEVPYQFVPPVPPSPPSPGTPGMPGASGGDPGSSSGAPAPTPPAGTPVFLPGLGVLGRLPSTEALDEAGELAYLDALAFLPMPTGDVDVPEAALPRLTMPDADATLGATLAAAHVAEASRSVAFELPRMPQGTAVRAPVPDLNLDLALEAAQVNVCLGSCATAPGAQAAASQADGASRAPPFEAPGRDLREHGFDHRPASPLAPLADVGSAQPAARPAPASAVQAVRDTLAAVPADAGGLLAASLVALSLLAPWMASQYSKIRRDATLLNATRRMVYEAVVATPGLSIQEVARRASMSHSTAAYHLERLARAGLVVATGDGNKVRYYRNGGRFSEPERLLLPCLENAETVQVLEAVLHRPSTYRAELAATLGVTSTTVSWHLKRLFRCGVVLEQRRGRNAHLFVEREALRAACVGLHEKIADSPARDAAARILATLAAMPPAPPLALHPQPALPVPAAAHAAAPRQAVTGPMMHLAREMSPGAGTIGRLETL